MLGGLSQDDLITVVVFTSLELLGAIVMLGATFSILRAKWRARGMIHVPGVVARHEPYVTSMTGAGGHGSTRRTLLRPIIRFVTPDGASHELAHPVGSSAPMAIGSEVRVALDPARPGHAEVVSLLASYFAPVVIFVAVGMFMVVLMGVEFAVLR